LSFENFGIMARDRRRPEHQQQFKFGLSKPLSMTYRPLPSAPIHSWIGSWAEDSLTTLPRIFVSLERSSSLGQDSLRLRLVEALRPSSEVVVDLKVDGLAVVSGTHFVYLGPQFASKSLLGGGTAVGETDALALAAEGQHLFPSRAVLEPTDRGLNAVQDVAREAESLNFSEFVAS
jgi:hypothetical protein